MIERYKDSRGVDSYKGVKPSTPFDSLDFVKLKDQPWSVMQWALHTNIGTLTVVDRMTGFGCRDVESGYRDMDNNFYLAMGGFDVRVCGAKTMQDAIDWVKVNNSWGDVLGSYVDKVAEEL